MRKSRCPYHTKAIKKDRVLNISLKSQKEERFGIIKEGVTEFHSNLKYDSLHFHLDESVLNSVSSIYQLNLEILSYQAEISAIELDIRLYPFLRYQMQACAENILQEKFDNEPHRFAAAHYLSLAVESTNKNISFKSVHDLQYWIQSQLFNGFASGSDSPQLLINNKEKNTYLKISPGQIDLIFERDFNQRSNDLFSMVTCPFYPKGAWRYSEDIQIVLTRMSDFNKIDPNEVRQIRSDYTKINNELGVSTNNGPIGSGLWIPKL